MKKWLFIVGLLLFLPQCYVGRLIVYNVADTRDYKKFPQVIITPSPEPFRFYRGKQINLDSLSFPDIYVINKKKIRNYESLFKRTKTTAFLIIRHDTILYERYFRGYDSLSIFPSFSMSKSVISLLIGIALGEGKITSLDDPVIKYIPELRPELKKVTIRHLLNMESGFQFQENYYNPFAEIAKYYYGDHLKQYIKKLKLKKEPGREFEYQSVNTLLLALVLESATGMPSWKYLETRFWQKIGTSLPATINLDSPKDSTFKAFCCLNATARDFAKLGKIMLDRGKYNDQQIIPTSYVDLLFNPETKKSPKKRKKSVYFYRYHWWYDSWGNLAAYGFLGQLVIIFPSKHMIMVRLGDKNGGVDWPQIMNYIAKQL
ncbi:MAG: beta-lactamase family protein [Bacteroidales bacterium]|nr:beta-lactamase family protein [Bacteroidales bacterium]